MDSRFELRVDEAEVTLWRAAAGLDELSVSEWARAALNLTAVSRVKTVAPERSSVATAVTPMKEPEPEPLPAPEPPKPKRTVPCVHRVPAAAFCSRCDS